MTRPRLDLAGQRFGKLTAIKPVDQDKKKNVLWVCQCDCGRLDVVSAARLRSGKKTDCGCVRKELLAKSKAEREAEQKAIKLAKLQLKAEKEAEKEAKKSKNRRTIILREDG